MPLIIAHRGASGYLPEHTLQAKSLAHEMGADYLEQDVVATRDDALVVLHDVQLDSVTDVAERFPERARDNGHFYVRDFDLEELRKLRVWERMKPDGTAVYPSRYPIRSGDFRIHTLAEEIALVQRLNRQTGRQAGIYPEIKRPAWHRSEGIDITPLLLETIGKFGYDHRDDPVFVQCFDDAEIRRLKDELDCPWKLVQLVGENDWEEADTDYDTLRSRAGLEQLARYADAIGPWVQHLYEVDATDGAIVASKLTRTAHEYGLAVHAYTFRVDDLPPGFGSFDDLLRYCVEDLRIDGLFTDFPDKARELLDNDVN